MKRIMAIGVFFELALLIIGVTWIGNWSAPEATASEAATTTGAQDYRIQGDGNGTVVNVDLVAQETTQEIADGVSYQVWTFNGTVPAPVIRVKLGDTIHFTLTNNTTHNLSHSIDFHAAQTPWDKNYQPVNPGETLSFDWVARFPGVFMYHCGVPPVLMHIANGMYGAIIVEPDHLEPAREYVLVSSEFYPGKEREAGALLGSLDQMLGARPTYVEFNGGFNRYLDEPLVAKPDELIRVWVMNAGPTLTNAFHVIGALFDHVYPDGNPTDQLNGLQTYNVAPGAGAMFEMRIPDEGLYPFVTHSFAYTGLGAVGVIKIDPNAPSRPESYPLMGDPFSGGVLPAGEPTVTPTGPSTAPTTSPTSTPSTGGGSEVSISASITAGFSPATFDVKEGEITLTLTNADAFPHDLMIDALGLKIQLPPSATVTQTFSATTGVYELYCSIPGHREAGMVGTMTVTPAMAH